MYWLNRTLTNVSTNANILNLTLNSIKKSFSKGYCSSISVAYTPALKNSVYQRLEKHGGIIYIFLSKKNNINASDNSGFLAISLSNNKPVFKMVLTSLAIVPLLEMVIELFVSDDERLREKHSINRFIISFVDIIYSSHSMDKGSFSIYINCCNNIYSL